MGFNDRGGNNPATMSGLVQWPLPSSWTWTTIADLGEVVSGGTPSTKEPSFWNGGVNWITPADLSGYSGKHIAQGHKSLSELGLKNSSAILMPSGSILFSSRAPIGYVAISVGELSTNQGFKSLVPSPEIASEYVYYYLKSAKRTAENLASGTTFLELSGSAFRQLPIPVPPVNEQRRIVAKLEELFSELDAGVASLKTAREQLKVYRQALLKHAFEGKLTAAWRAENADKLEAGEELLARIGVKRVEQFRRRMNEWENAVQKWQVNGRKGRKPAKPRKLKSLPPMTRQELAELPSLPSGWSWLRFGAVFAETPKNGLYKPATDYGSGTPIIRIDDFYDGNLVRRTGFKRLRIADAEAIDFLVEQGDLLVNRVNSIEYVGKCCTVPALSEATVFESNIMKITLLEEFVSSRFAAEFLSSYLGFSKLRSNAKHAINQASINQTDVAMTPIPVPSLHEQSALLTVLARGMTAVSKLLEEVDSAIRRAEVLRQSVLKRAFSGQLVPQDPRDEPASVLLERIRAEKVSAADAKPARRQRRPSKLAANP